MSTNRNMEQSTIPLNHKNSKVSSLPVMTRNRASNRRSGKISTRSFTTPVGSVYSGCQDKLAYSYADPKQNVTLPVVTTLRHCAKVDINCNMEDGERHTSDNDVVIVQLFTERCYNAHSDSNNNLSPRSPRMSPPQQRPKSQRKNTKLLMDNLVEGSFSRTATQSAEPKAKNKNEVNTASGFTQTELKIHTDREKQKTTIYLLNEQERSKRIVADWLKTLPE